MPLLKIKKWHNVVQGESKESELIIAEPKKRHVVKWEVMTMTMTIGMDARIAYWGTD